MPLNENEQKILEERARLSEEERGSWNRQSQRLTAAWVG